VLKFRTSLLVVLTGAVCVLPHGVFAQSDDDWDVRTDPSQDLTVAEAHYSSGQSLRVQCLGGEISVGLTGLVPSSGATRTFDRERSSGLSEVSIWEVGADGATLIHHSPRVARSLKRDTVLRLRSTAPEQSPLLVALPLPSPSRGIDEVLKACGRAVEDDRDDVLDVGGLIERLPRVEMAAFSDRRFTIVQLEMSFLIRNSRLSECRPDHETPDAGIGWRTARRANGAEVQLRDPVAAEGRLVDIVITGNRIYR
jgi:hypothetical protein